MLLLIVPRGDTGATPFPAIPNALGGIVWASGIGLLAYFGGKALANAVSRYGLYAGATIAVVAVFLTTAPKLIERMHGST